MICFKATAVESDDNNESLPVHRDDPGIVCPAGNPRGSVRGGEDDRGVAVVVHPRLVAKPIVGHDRSVSRRLNRSCWLGRNCFLFDTFGSTCIQWP